MPKVQISHKSTSNPADAFKKVQTFMQGPDGLKKFDPKAEFQFDESQNSGKIKGGQFTANFSITPSGSGSQIELTVDLPLLLTPLKGKIQETITQQLTKYVS